MKFIVVIVTLAVLCVAALVVALFVYYDNRKFRNTLNPGDYANVKTPGGMVRAKFLGINIVPRRMYLLQNVDSKQLIYTVPSNIYRA